MTNVLVSIAHIPARTSTITDSFPIVYLPQRILDFPEHSISYLPVSAGLGGHAVEMLVEDLGEASVAGHGYLLDHGVYKVSLALYEHIMNNTNFPSRCPPLRLLTAADSPAGGNAPLPAGCRARRFPRSTPSVAAQTPDFSPAASHRERNGRQR